MNYNEKITLVETITNAYGNNQVVTEYDDVCAIFLAGTGFVHNRFSDSATSDAVCYIDPQTDFLKEKSYRIEGWYILAPVFAAEDSESWYKITRVTINRDHLLGNTIDNVELQLKKTIKPYGWS